MTLYKVEYDIDVWQPQSVPQEDKTFEGLQVIRHDLRPPMSKEEFDDEWLGLVVRTTIDYLPLYDHLTNASMYLGRFNDGTRIVVLGTEMDTYSADILYNGYRVSVSARETDWGQA